MTGFTGVFSTSNWGFYVNDANIADAPCDDLATNSGCLVLDGATNGDVILGAQWQGAGDGPIVVWRWPVPTWPALPPGSTGYTVSLNYEFFGNDESSAAVMLANSNVVTVASGGSGSINQLFVGSGSSLEFKITVPISDATIASFAITGFEFNPAFVPAPLPAGGAASTFLLARRMRRRLRDERAVAGLRPVPARASHAYLCHQLGLDPQGLTAVPLCFDYSHGARLREGARFRSARASLGESSRPDAA